MAVSRVDRMAVWWVAQWADSTVACSAANLVAMMAAMTAVRSVVLMAAYWAMRWAAGMVGCSVDP